MRERKVRGCHQTGRRPVVLTAGISRGHCGLGILPKTQGDQRTELVQRSVCPRVFVFRYVARLLSLGDLQGHQFPLEASRCLSRHRALVGAQRPFILFRPADSILTAQVLRRLDHAAGNRKPRATGRDAATLQRITHQHAAVAAYPPPHVGYIEGGVAH